MVWMRNPLSLQDILYSYMTKVLLMKCPTTANEVLKFYKYRTDVRNYVSRLPLTVAERLVESAFNKIKSSSRDRPNTVSGIEENYLKQLYILEIFLHEHTKTIQVNLQCFSIFLYSSRLMELLSEYSQNATSIIMYSGRYIRSNLVGKDYQLLKQTFSSATNLTILTLRGICTDQMLCDIGRECCKLEELDVCFSPITDIGINLLTQNITEVKQPIKDDHSQWKSTLCTLPDIFPSVTQLVPLRDLIPQGNETKHYSRVKSPLCATLRKLQFQETYTSHKGLFVALELLPNLEVLGREINELLLAVLDKAARLIQQNKIEPLKLTKVEVGFVSEDMNVVKTLFPRMQKLICRNFLPDVDYDIIPTVECLVVREFISRVTVNPLKLYLQNKGKSLKELYLAIRDNEIDFSSLLSNCTNLNTLNIKADLAPFSYTPPLQNVLRKIKIYCVVSQDCLITILKRVPNIEELVIEGIVDAPENSIEEICAIGPRPNWKVFWVSRGRVFETEQKLILFLDAFDQIKVLGKLPSSLEKYDFGTLYDEEMNYL